jgi:hypothetical protein
MIPLSAWIFLATRFPSVFDGAARRGSTSDTARAVNATEHRAREIWERPHLRLTSSNNLGSPPQKSALDPRIAFSGPGKPEWSEKASVDDNVCAEASQIV